MATLTVEEGPGLGAECEVPPQGSVCVGRSSACDLVILDRRVSRQHFRIEAKGSRYILVDLGSHNGTFINEEKVLEQALLSPGDAIRIGETVMRLHEGPRASLAGTVIAGYRLERRLGSGGMGEVYRATQLSLGRTVAVKVLHQDLTSDRAFVARFVAEARAAGALNHPNIVQVYDVGEENGRYYYSMELVAGGNVQELVQGGIALDPMRATEIILQAAHALEYAEKKGIVHCDVKPDNLMLTTEGDVKLADLGIAKRVGETASGGAKARVQGSPHYMSPEQARGERLDNRSDLYSLGATFYRLLAGRPPFSGGSAREVMEKQVFEEPEPVTRANPSVPGALGAIVSKLLKKRPADRYQTANALVRDLEEARQLLAGRRAPEEQEERRDATRVFVLRARPRASRAAGGVFFVCILGAAAAGGVLVARQFGRAGQALERAEALERAGKLAQAASAYEEAIALAGSGPKALRARARLEAVREEISKRNEVAKAEAAIAAAELEAAPGGEALANALAKVEEVARSNAAAQEAALPVASRLRERLAAEAARELSERKRKAAALVSEMRYGEACQLLSEFPLYYGRTGAAEEAAAEAEQVKSRAAADFAAARERASKLVEELPRRASALDEALAVLLPFIHRSGMAEIASQARTARAALELRAQEIRQELEEQARAAKAEEIKLRLARAGFSARRYRYAEAREIVRMVQNSLKDSGDAPRSAALEQKVEEIKRCEILFESLLRHISEGTLSEHVVTLPSGQKARAAGVRRESRELLAKTEGGELVALPWEHLAPDQVLRLFRAMPLTPEEHLVLAEFCLDHGMAQELQRELAYASRVRQANRAFAESVKARAEAAGSLERPDEKDAQMLAATALAEASRGRAKEAREAAALLRARYASTAAAATLEEIESALNKGGAK